MKEALHNCESELTPGSIENKVRVLDYGIIWEEDIVLIFVRSFRYLTAIGNSIILMSPKRFISILGGHQNGTRKLFNGTGGNFKRDSHRTMTLR